MLFVIFKRGSVDLMRFFRVPEKRPQNKKAGVKAGLLQVFVESDQYRATTGPPKLKR